MSNVIEKANELGQVMKDDATVVAYREAVKRIEQDQTKKRMVEDFRSIQFAAYQDKMTTGEVSEATKKRMEDTVGIIALNQEISEFLEIEQNFSILFNDIMNIINGAIGVDIIG